jgi:hypothetical protein
MQRSQRFEFVQISDYLTGHDGWSGIAQAAVHNTVTDAEHAGGCVRGSQPSSEYVKCTALAAYLRFDTLIDQYLAYLATYRYPRRAPYALYLATRHKDPVVLFTPRERAELQAG